VAVLDRNQWPLSRRNQWPLSSECAAAGQGGLKRFNRTLKERVIHVHVNRNLDELRDAIHQIADRYYAQGLVWKNGFPNPNQAREQGNAARSVRAPGNRARYTWSYAEWRGLVLVL